MSNTRSYIAQLIQNNFSYPVCFINSNHQIIYQSRDSNSLDLSEINLDNLFLGNDMAPTIDILFSNQAYLCQPYHENEKCVGLFLIGPLDYERHPFTQILHQAQLIYYLIYQKQISFTELHERNFYLEADVQRIDFKINTDFTTLRLTTDEPAIFMPILYEKQILSAIQYGDANLLLEALSEFNVNQQFLDTLQEDPVRSFKTLYMTLIILGARAAITGGMPPNYAHKMTIAYLEKIEKSSNLHHLQQLKVTGLLDFTNRVKMFHDDTLSRPVIDTILYVIKHLYEDLSLSQIADDLHFSSSYLARLFKKEMKMTIGDFIVSEKIEEAKRLLIASSCSLLEITALLHFNDQSHFTRVFKRVTGMTPKKYRDKYKIPF